MFCRILFLIVMLPFLFAGGARQIPEWEGHRSADGSSPTPMEQEMLFLANRARQNPAAEGVWLATEPQVKSRFGGFAVNWEQMQAEFAALPSRPPVAFDARILAGEDAHAEYMLSICQQTHNGQRERVTEAGFLAKNHRVVAWTQADTALWGHVAFQIDFGGPTSEGGMQKGRPHRVAIMGEATHAGYGSIKGDRRSCQPNLSFSGSFATAAAADEPSRFLVGTVYQDLNKNGRFDAGEGIGGVEIRLVVGSWYAVTAPAGGYALPLPKGSGDLFVVFTHGEQIHFQTIQVTNASFLLDWVIP